MKKSNYIILVLILFLNLFSSPIFAQTAPGGSGDGGSIGSGNTSPQPCPVSFKRNDGNGTCGGDAQIRLNFNQLPQFAPTLVSIWYDGEEITNIITPIEGDASTLSKGYVSYCLSGANIPPAKKLVLHFRYPDTDQDDCVIAE